MKQRKVWCVEKLAHDLITNLGNIRAKIRGKMLMSGTDGIHFIWRRTKFKYIPYMKRPTLIEIGKSSSKFTWSHSNYLSGNLHMFDEFKFRDILKIKKMLQKCPKDSKLEPNEVLILPNSISIIVLPKFLIWKKNWK